MFARIVLVAALGGCGVIAPQMVHAVPATLSSPIMKALRMVEEGDVWLLNNNPDRACKTYLEALSLAPDVLPIPRRLEVISQLAFNDHLDDAIEQLKVLLDKEPGNLQANIMFARYLSWSGRLKPARHAIDQALLIDPFSQEARQEKSMISQWQGDYLTSLYTLPVAHARTDNFDLKVTHINALIDRGEVEWATLLRDGLDAKAAHQRSLLKRLDIRLSQASDPALELKYGKFVDSDNNQRTDQQVGTHFHRHRVEYGLNYKLITATDAQGRMQFERVWGSIDFKPNSTWNIKALAGNSRNIHDESGNIFLAEGMINLSFPAWYGSAYINNDLLSDTATLMRNVIQIQEKRVKVNFLLTDELSLDVRGRMREYSDDNASKNFQFAPWYTVKRQSPRINFGYRYEHQNFKTQTESGYFDPKTLQSKQVLVALSHRAEYFTGSMELGYGVQAFEYNRSNSKNDTFSYYLEGRFDVSKDLAVVCSGEGGDYALSTPGGYKYKTYNVNVRRYF